MVSEKNDTNPNNAQEIREKKLKNRVVAWPDSSSRQTLVNHQYLDPAEGTHLWQLIVSEHVFRGQICNLEIDG